MHKRLSHNLWMHAVVLTMGLCGMVLYIVADAQGQAPRYMYDPGWPKPLPNKWKMGGVTALAVAPNDDTVWVYDRPNDMTNLELEAEVGASDCCVRPPSMIHIDKAGNVIGSIDAPQGHGMDIGARTATSCRTSPPTMRTASSSAARRRRSSGATSR